MLEKAKKEKLIKRIKAILAVYKISEDISYTVQEKDGIYQCVIKYQRNGKWTSFWATTGYRTEKGNLRNAKKVAEEISNIFKETVKENDTGETPQVTTIIDFQTLMDLNTTNYNPNKRTKADWDFYEYMEYWVNNVIITSVAPDTYVGYKRLVKGRLKDYFTMEEHKKAVKEITSDDLDDFYDYLRGQNLKNGTIDHYNDNISSAFKFLLKKKLVRYNPTTLINPIVVEVEEVPTYTKAEVEKVFEVFKDEIIELPTLIDAYYGLRRSEIFGLRECVFDLENDTFIVNHVAIQFDGKDHKEKILFRDKTKSKKGCRTFPLFPEVKTAVIKKLKRIEENKKLFGNSYNHKYDGYLCVHDNGDFINPGYFTKRFGRVIKNNNMKKITPHGLRHSIATLLHMEGVDIRDLQDWLGHESITSTNRYTRSDFQKQVATANTVSKIFQKTSNNNNNKTKRFIIKRKQVNVAV